MLRSSLTELFLQSVNNLEELRLFLSLEALRDLSMSCSITTENAFRLTDDLAYLTTFTRWAAPVF